MFECFFLNILKQVETFKYDEERNIPFLQTFWMFCDRSVTVLFTF